MSFTKSDIPAFRRLVWAFYRKQGRHDLPWRTTRDPYRILVSEIMLQQTQVDRVKGFYKTFLKKFPTVRALAAAPLSEVLMLWQGLGYNRRAKMLHEAAKQIAQEYKGIFPTSVEVIQSLRGVGPYTARAVAAFAYNQDVVFIETNLRTVITHHFFPKKNVVTDAEILSVLAAIFPKGRSREWYAALMDYGAHLKRSGIRLNAKSKTYTKQSPFSGSNREARGAILKSLIAGPQTSLRLSKLLGIDRTEQMLNQLKKLCAEGLVTSRGNRFMLPP